MLGVKKIMFFKLVAPFYDWFMKTAGLDYSAKIAKLLSPVEGLEILDLAGGTGINARALAAAGGRVTLVDSSSAMLARAERGQVNALLVKADATKLPFQDSSFDIVLVSDAWHHFRQQETIAVQVTRVLKPGGRLYIIDFDRSKPKTWPIIILERLVGEPSTFLTTSELAFLLKQKGIDGESHYLTPHQYLFKGINNKRNKN